MGDRWAGYLARVRPKSDRVVFCRPAREFGRGLLDGPDAPKGCGHIVRLVYMAPKSPLAYRRGRPLPDRAVCMICGRAYLFAFWKLNSDHDYTPTDDEERDVRALFADLKRMAAGKDPAYDMPLEERVRIHCLRARGTGACDCDVPAATSGP